LAEDKVYGQLYIIVTIPQKTFKEPEIEGIIYMIKYRKLPTACEI
jgi:hypothetical protein